MNKEELIKSVCNSTGVTRITAEGVLKAFLDSVSDSLKSGEEVRLIGFGTFKTSKREATMGRNVRREGELGDTWLNQARFRVNDLEVNALPEF